ncbi:MAG: hypothetical protein Q8L88_00660 [Bacteroidota bacterium]|nr:hypothetical protein [Bacteroidota bacterium]
MNITAKSIALIEFSSSHSECLYTQLLFLKNAGYTVHLIIPEDLRAEVDGFNNVDSIKYIDPGHGFRGRWSCVFDVRNYLVSNGIRKVLFNTAEGNHVRDFCISAPFQIEFGGTIHHVNKLYKSFTQKLISLRVRKYFVLNDYLLERVSHHQRLSVGSYYPIFFPQNNNHYEQKPEGEIWIGIPGIVEFRRRDYKGLLEQLARCKPDAKLKFIVLGKCALSNGDGAEVRTIVRDLNLESQFQFFSDFIPRDTYLSYVRQCDFLLPLIHPSTSLYDIYGRWQISGAYNLGFGFAKPMLVHRALEHISDFRSTCYFYEIDEMVELMNTLAANPELILSKVSDIQRTEKFSFEYQCKQYIQFLEQ